MFYFIILYKIITLSVVMHSEWNALPLAKPFLSYERLLSHFKTPYRGCPFHKIPTTFLHSWRPPLLNQKPTVMKIPIPSTITNRGRPPIPSASPNPQHPCKHPRTHHQILYFQSSYKPHHSLMKTFFSFHKFHQL